MSDMSRYARQIVFNEFGAEGQKRLQNSRVLIVGAGGLGSWQAELLARAGVGFMRIADNDNIDLTNIQRQALYNESDAAQNLPKVEQLKIHIGEINHEVIVEPVRQRVDRYNIQHLAHDMDLIMDGMDNFPSRFLINDYAVKVGKPWIFGGVIGAEGQMAVFHAGGRPCLRCIMDAPPASCAENNCRSAGVFGPVVSAIASLQAMEALKILSGSAAAGRQLIKMNLWTGGIQRISLSEKDLRPDCPCCIKKEFEYLDD